MIQNYSGCGGCPLRDRPPVVGRNPSPHDLMIIGEAPGRDEVRIGQPFVGRSGELLWEVLRQIGVRRSDVYVTNVAICHPEGNATPTSAVVESCRERLYDAIRIVRPKKILLLGSTASQAIFKLSISKSRGCWQTMQLDDLTVNVLGTYHPAAILRDDDLFRDFSDDLQKWVDTDGPHAAPSMTVTIAKSADEALERLDLLSESSALSCDIETTGLNAETDDVLSVAFAAKIDGEEDASYCLVIPWSLYSESELVQKTVYLLSDWDGDIVLHNIKFDIQFLRRVLDAPWLYPRRPWDTMLMKYAQDERGGSSDGAKSGRNYSAVGLKDIARVRYDILDYKFDFDKFFLQLRDDPDRVDWEAFYRYQALDTHVTINLFWALREELRSESPKLLELVRRLLVPGALAFATLESNGFPIDVEYLQELEGTTTTEVATLVGDLRDLAQDEVLNPGSPVQIKKLFQSWGIPYVSGQREDLQFLQKSLDTTKPNHERAKAFISKLLEYRQRSKVLETYIRGLLKRVDPDSRVRSDFKIHGTDTGRLSSRNPNLQNIPTIMGPEIKRAFIAPPGWVVFNCDYSQLELRVAAFYSRDESLMKAFFDGVDVHRWVASLMFKKPLNEISSFERYLAKYVDFGLLYGRTARALTQGFEAEYILEMTGKRMTMEEADEIQSSFFNAFPGLTKFIASQHQFVRQNQYVETPTGRRRRFPYIDRSSVGSVERRSVNTPIQSLASDMTLNSIIRLTKVLDRTGAYVVSSVHDSIMLLVRNDRIESTQAIVHEVMETPVVPEFDVPLKVDIGYGQTWAEAKD